MITLVRHRKVCRGNIAAVADASGCWGNGTRSKNKNAVMLTCGQMLFPILVAFLALSPAAGQEGQRQSNEAEGLADEKMAAGGIEDIDLLELDVPVVVTASRRQQKAAHVPYAVSVITAKDIRMSGARSVPDALRLAAGVDVADLSYGNAAVSPRGLHSFTAKQTLVLVDGRQIFDSIFGGTLWGSWPFQLEDIERIEVIRGPAGVTWGANAVNGVINIITKDPKDQLGVTGTSGAASLGTFKEHLGYAFADEKLRLRISGEYEASDGFRKGGSILRNFEDDYKAGRVGLHAIYDAGPNDTLTLSGGTNLLDGGASQPPLGGFGLSRNPGTQASFLLAKWTHRIEKDNEIQFTGYVNDFQGSNGLPALDYRYQQLAFQLSHTFKPADTHTIVWGIDNRTDLIDSSNADPFLHSKSFISTDIIGVYIQDEWRFAPKWALNLGGRIDYDFYGGFQPSARAALSYELTDKSLLYGAVSRAFQMPPGAARFEDIPLLNGLVRATADRDQEAQSLIAYELGYRSRFFDRLETNLSLFCNQYRDVSVASTKLGPPGLANMHYNDDGEGILYGLELDAKYAVNEKLTLLGNYTFQRLDWTSSAPLVQTDAISPPKHKFMLGSRYSLTKDLHLSSHLYYVDTVKAPNPANPILPRHVDPYFRLDLRAEHEFWEDRASIAVGVRNLLDSNHYEGGTSFLNDAEVPRMAFIELRIHF